MTDYAGVVYLQRMILQTENILISVAQLSKLYQRVL